MSFSITFNTTNITTNRISTRHRESYNKQKILAYKDTDPYRWQVYGLGKIGKLEGLVLSDWIEVESMPNGYDYVIRM